MAEPLKILVTCKTCPFATDEDGHSFCSHPDAPAGHDIDAEATARCRREIRVERSRIDYDVWSSGHDVMPWCPLKVRPVLVSLS